MDVYVSNMKVRSSHVEQPLLSILAIQKDWMEPGRLDRLASCR